jgi:hypothetical protein
MENMMTEAQAYARFGQWLKEFGSRATPDVSEFESAPLNDDVWILTPPGRANTIYVVTPALVRMIHPSEESLPDVLAELGIEA